jgi:DNA-binding transcriptional MerR regulator
LAEYRLDELARISGVSARNIRAYRERGLLDPPRRVGRSAFYDDYHLSQLRTINQLHRRGFNSAHIAEFFASLRQGADLADILGIQRAVLGPRTESADEDAQTASPDRPLDPDSDEARLLVDYGLAEQVDGTVTLIDPVARQIIARADDPQAYARVLLHIAEATREAIDGLAGGFVRVLDECVAARFGADHAPGPGETDGLGQVVRDFRELWNSVVTGRLDTALQQQVTAAGSEYAAGVLLSRRRKAEAT